MKRICYPALVILLVGSSGCSSGFTLATAYTTPEVLEPGEYEVGSQLSYSRITSIAGGDKEAEFLKPASPLCLYGRVGYTRNADVGVRIFIYQEGMGFYPDLKIKLLGSSTFLTMDLGMFVGVGKEGPGAAGFSPMLLLGTNRFYSGLRYAGNEVSLQETDMLYSIPPVSLILGGSIGEKIRILPEVQLYFGAVLVSIGVRWSPLSSNKPPD